MYFIELIVNAFIKRNKKRTPVNNYDPMQENLYDEDYEACEHIFMPIDSTGEVLACRNCGLVVNKKDLKNKNFFMRKNSN